ncbi:aspartate transaminase [Malassezia psittaci]|uniref:aspartate transaminase n=1 Tax=Malassezia psittaci TaxID=1821823 RepID=A0AAF0JCT3_9BASI|nr:aspartate transaminase [Malassezia psittaci]
MHAGNLAVGTDKSVLVYQRGSYTGAQWRRAFKSIAPHSLLAVRWSPDGQYLAAVPLHDHRVMVWYNGSKEWTRPKLVSRLQHTRIVHGIDWRRACDESLSRPVLVVTLSNCVALIYAPTVDEPQSLRHWASIDPAMDLGLETTSDPVSLMYTDAYRLRIALNNELEQIRQSEQLIDTGVNNRSASNAKAIDKTLLSQLLTHTLDLFLCIYTDGSIAIYTVNHIESSIPTLLNSYVLLRLPNAVIVEPSVSPVFLHFMPLPPSSALSQGKIKPTAVVHAQSASGMRGTAVLGLASLLDGDPRGLLIQNTLLGHEQQTDPMSSGSPAGTLLRAEHKTDIIALYPAPNGRSVLSLSLDGVLIGWHLETGSGSSLLSEHRMRARDASAVCMSSDALDVVLLFGDSIAVMPIYHAGNEGGHQVSGTRNFAPQILKLPGDLKNDKIIAFNLLCQSGATSTLAVCTKRGWLLTFSVGPSSEPDPDRIRLLNKILLGSGENRRSDFLAAAFINQTQLSMQSRAVLCTASEDGFLNLWDLEGDCCMHLAIEQFAVSSLALSRSGYAALAGTKDRKPHVSIYNLNLASFASVCEFSNSVGSGSQHPAIAWSFDSTARCMLAIGFGKAIQIWAPSTQQHGTGPVSPKWSPLAEVQLDADSSAKIGNLTWLAGDQLLVASECQLFLYAAGTDKEDVSHRLPFLAAQNNALISMYHPRHIQYCAQMRLFEAISEILKQLRQAMNSPLYDADHSVDFDVKWRIFCKRSPREKGDNDLFLVSLVQELTELLKSKRAPGLDSQDNELLCAVLDSVHTILCEPVDEAGRQFLSYLDVAFAETKISKPSSSVLTRGSMLFWAQLCQSQEILIGRVRTLCGQRIEWNKLCASGVFAWCKDRSSLIPLMEDAARAAYAAKDDIDPIHCSLLYLAMRREATVRSVWRRAHGHRDQAKMNRFLANDFEQERWQVAAQKNAYALISQRRFDFAATFFLLGGALQDAVNVCVQNMEDLPLAIAIARVYEEQDSGPVFLGLIERSVLPYAIKNRDRWLASWAFSVLNNYEDAVRVMDTPLNSFVREAKEYGWNGNEIETVQSDVQDPALILAIEHVKMQGWGNVHNETGFVAMSARRWNEMAKPQRKTESGTDPVPTKLAPLFAQNHAPAASQGASEFDLDAVRPVFNFPKAVRLESVWAGVPAGPPDPILGVTEAFKKDTDPRKINLGVGAYRDGSGKPYVLPSVYEAEGLIFSEKLDKEYLPITGLKQFDELAAKLAYGEKSKPLLEERIATTQTISGTGALRVGGEFLAKHYPGPKTIYVPTPTWGNHIPIFKNSGLEVKHYTYYNKDTCGLNFDGMIKDLKNAPEHSIVLLHACAHNPTGVDPTHEQWRKIAEVVKEKGHFPFFDMAYQGFASGDADHDAYAVRYFVEQGFEIALSQSFAKNMGMYGERTGLFSIVTESVDEKNRVESQLKITVRPMISNPPVHGARIAAKILSDEKLKGQWLEELRGMSGRIQDMRAKLKNLLTQEFGSKRNWDHITNQIGMFAFLGISPEQVEELIKEHHVYLTKDGRISVAGITDNNVRHLAESLAKVTA